MTDTEKDAARWNAFLTAILENDIIFMQHMENKILDASTKESVNDAIDYAMEKTK